MWRCIRLMSPPACHTHTPLSQRVRLSSPPPCQAAPGSGSRCLGSSQTSAGPQTNQSNKKTTNKTDSKGQRERTIMRERGQKNKMKAREKTRQRTHESSNATQSILLRHHNIPGGTANHPPPYSHTIPWSSFRRTWAAPPCAGMPPRRSLWRPGWTGHRRWPCWCSGSGRGLSRARRAHHSQCAGAGDRNHNARCEHSH